MSNVKLFQVVYTAGERINFTAESLIHFSLARELGKKNKKEWIDHLNVELEGAIERGLNICQNEDRNARINHLYRLKN